MSVTETPPFVFTLNALYLHSDVNNDDKYVLAA